MAPLDVDIQNGDVGRANAGDARRSLPVDADGGAG